MTTHHLNETRTAALSLANQRAEPRPAPDNTAEANRWRERMKPLQDRVRALLVQIPPEVQAEGISVRALSEQLMGKYRGSAAQREIAAALRALGYTSRRQWQQIKTTGAVNLWFPPQQ